MVMAARSAGTASDSIMWESIDDVDMLLCEMKKLDESVYWRFMRKAAGRLHKHHYCKMFAEYDVSQMHSTDGSGRRYRGEHWSAEEVVSATSAMSFPQGVTEWDKYVAFNTMWHDLHKQLPDDEILKIAHLVYFCDEDYRPDSGTKIWRVMDKN